MPVSKDSFKSFCNTLTAASKLILSILGGILSLVDDLFGLMSVISFTISLKVTRSNENLFWLSTFLLIKIMLGWCYYISIALLAGSSIFLKFWFMILEFSLKSKKKTASLKKVFNSSAIFYDLAVLHLFPRVLCYFRNFEKNGLTFFNLLSLAKEGFSLLNNFLRFFW